MKAAPFTHGDGAESNPRSEGAMIKMNKRVTIKKAKKRSALMNHKLLAEERNEAMKRATRTGEMMTMTTRRTRRRRTAKDGP